MIWFVLSMMVFLIAFGFSVGALAARDGLYAGIAVGCAVVGALMLMGSCIREVSTKNVGIETSFGRPVGSLDNGLHFTAPWVTVTEMDAAIQTDSYYQTQGGCVNVRIAYQIVACIDVSVRWRIQDKAADYLFKNYRDFTNVRDSLVTRELSTSLNQVFATYDPLQVNGNGDPVAPPLNALSAQVVKIMAKDIGQYVKVLNVLIPVLHYDDAVQGRINAFQAQVAATRIAQQGEKTAAAQAAQNRILAASVDNKPNVLISKCLDLVQAAINANYSFPAGWSCWGGSSAVVVPSK